MFIIDQGKARVEAETLEYKEIVQVRDVVD